MRMGMRMRMKMKMVLAMRMRMRNILTMRMRMERIGHFSKATDANYSILRRQVRDRLVPLEYRLWICGTPRGYSKCQLLQIVFDFWNSKRLRIEFLFVKSIF
jgi:hypothetical protein